MSVDPPERKRIKGLCKVEGTVEGPGEKPKGPELYDRSSAADWRETFGLDRRARRRERRASLNLTNPYEEETPVVALASTPYECPVKPGGIQPEAVTLTNLIPEDEPRRPGKRKIGDPPPKKVPIREPMSTIRAIVARVKSGAEVNQSDISALNYAFEQLGNAAIECKAAANWKELKFIGRVRNLLGSYLRKTVPKADKPERQAPSTDVVDGQSADDDYSSATRPRLRSRRVDAQYPVVDDSSPGRPRFRQRRDLDLAGELVLQTGTSEDQTAQRPRVDHEMTTALTFTAQPTLGRRIPRGDFTQAGRLLSSDEAERLVSLGDDPSRPISPVRLNELEQLGVLVSQRDRIARSIT